MILRLPKGLKIANLAAAKHLRTKPFIFLTNRPLNHLDKIAVHSRKIILARAKPFNDVSAIVTHTTLAKFWGEGG